MTIAELIALCETRLGYLATVRAAYERQGDVPQIERVDAEVAQTQATLNALRSLG